MPKRYELGWVEEWQGNRGILMTPESDAWYFVQAYNIEPDGHHPPVKVGERVAFQWMHAPRNKMAVSRCVRLELQDLPPEWIDGQDLPPSVGRWIPVSRLGRGGNGDVWRGHGDGTSVAIKYLHRDDGEGYRRFRDDISVMLQVAGTPGVLPVLDHGLPKTLSRQSPAWMVMPLARTLASVIENAGYDEVIRAFADVAETLASLAERGIAHRDIKPDNLLWYEDRAVLGDLGLVDFPDKTTLTSNARKLGPLFYIAPEMLNQARDADGLAADVYSFAKALWVMVTRQAYPLPGEHRDAIFQMRLSTYVGWRARPLDKLLAEATRFVPSKRPKMKDVASTLRAWLSGDLTPRRVSPRACTESELGKVGVQLVDATHVVLSCMYCPQVWSPPIMPGGRLRRGYWYCPSGCNRSA